MLIDDFHVILMVLGLLPLHSMYVREKNRDFVVLSLWIDVFVGLYKFISCTGCLSCIKKNDIILKVSLTV